MSDAFGFARGLVFQAQLTRISFARNYSSSGTNGWSPTNRPCAPFEYASGTSIHFPRMKTYGRASSLVGGLEEKWSAGSVEGP